jgi:hypothetical protein
VASSCRSLEAQASAGKRHPALIRDHCARYLAVSEIRRSPGTLIGQRDRNFHFANNDGGRFSFRFASCATLRRISVGVYVSP